MKSAQKWDFKKKEYEPVEISDKCSVYDMNLRKKVECPGCGKVIALRDGYTSMCYQTYLGFGYIVCSKCYGKEFEELLNCLKELQK